MENARGFALLVVLWFLVLIASISAYLIANARQETAIARNVVSAAHAEALADAGIALAVFNQIGSAEHARWNLDGAPHRISLPGGEVAIRLHDERRKVNPNLASEALLSALFEAAGVERPLARRIGASIADWVDRDGDPRPLGAEREHYARAGRSYTPPNLPVESLDELQLVLGVTPQSLALALPYLTIYSATPRPDGMGAPPVIQRALLSSPASDDDQDTRNGNRAPASDDPGLTADERAAAEAAEQAAAAGTAAEPADSPVIAVEVTARASGGGAFIRQAVIRIEPMAPKGHVVLDWRRGDRISD